MQTRAKYMQAQDCMMASLKDMFLPGVGGYPNANNTRQKTGCQQVADQVCIYIHT